jgi:hypothetical protein
VDSLFHSASIAAAQANGSDHTVCFFARETAHKLLSILLWYSSTVWIQLGKAVLQMSKHSSAVPTHVVVAKQCAVAMVNLAWQWFHIGCTNASPCCRVTTSCCIHDPSLSASASRSLRVTLQVAPVTTPPRGPRRPAGHDPIRAPPLVVLAKTKLDFALRDPTTVDDISPLLTRGKVQNSTSTVFV